MGVFGGIVAAVGEGVPISGFQDGFSSQLEDSLHQHVGMSKLVGSVLQKFSYGGVLHGSFHHFGANSVLVIGQPLVGQSFVE